MGLQACCMSLLRTGLLPSCLILWLLAKKFLGVSLVTAETVKIGLFCISCTVFQFSGIA
jgi:hypothetical protein